MLKTARKAVAGFYSALPSGVLTLGALGFLSGSAQHWVIGAAAAAVPFLSYIGVYKAPANTAATTP